MKNTFENNLGPKLTKEKFYSKMAEMKKQSVWYTIEDSADQIDADFEQLYIPYFSHYQTYLIIYKLLKRHFQSFDMQKISADIRNYIKDCKIKPSEPGFMIIGSTGTGKTMLAKMIIKMIGQVKVFPELNNLIHIPILLVESPSVPEIKQLKLNILRAVDKLTGNTDYSIKSKDLSGEELGDPIDRVVKTYKIGMIIFDEIHNLSSNRPVITEKTIKTLNSLKSFSNTANIPMCYIGTHEAERLLSSLQTARRISGEANIEMVQPHMFSPIPKERLAWKSLIKEIWDIQIDGYSTKLTFDIEKLYYHKTLGIPFLVIELHKKVLHRLLERIESDGKPHKINKNLINSVSQDLTDYNNVIKSFPLESTARKYIQYTKSVSENISKAEYESNNNHNTSDTYQDLTEISDDYFSPERSITEMTSRSNDADKNFDILLKRGVIKNFEEMKKNHCA